MDREELESATTRTRYAGWHGWPRLSRPNILLCAVLLFAATACSGPSPAPTATATTQIATPTAPVEPTTARSMTPTATRAATTTTPATRAAASPPTTGRAGATTTRPGSPPASPFSLNSATFTRAGLDGQAITALASGGPTSPVLYAGGSGVFRSNDRGKTWTNVRNTTQAPRVAALAVAPSNAQTVFVGVSEGCARGGTHPGFVSTDGGASWRESGDNLLAVAFDPRDARLVYAVSCAGVQRSNDTGMTWETLGGARLDNYDPVLIAIATADPQTLYAAYASEGGSVRVQRSTNGGTTWQEASPPGEPFGPLDFAIDGRDARIVYLSTLTGLYKSSNGGRSWDLLTSRLDDAMSGTGGSATVTPMPPGTRRTATVAPTATPTPGRTTVTPTPTGRAATVTPTAERAPSPTGAAMPSSTTRTNTALATDPDESGLLWLGTAAGRTGAGGVLRTRDGGTTWSKAARGLEDLPVNALALGGPRNDRQLYVATDDGVWVTAAR